METWLRELEARRPERAWDAFLDRYRRLVFATIRRFVEDHDDVMDVFTHVCEALRDDDFRRLRSYAAGQADRRARFSTWLVVVVRNLTIDWVRRRYGRPRGRTLAPEDLPPLQRLIYEHLVTAERSHAEAYELIRSRHDPHLTFARFLKEAAAFHRRLAAEPVLLPAGSSRAPPDSVQGRRDPAELAEVRAILEHVLAELPPADRTAVQMYVIDELPAAEVARVLGLQNAKAVYNRVYRALSALRSALEAAGLDRDDL